MKRILFLTLTLFCVLCTSAQEQTQRPRRQRYEIPTDAPIKTKQQDDTVVINTSALCKDVRGYRDMTPVQIFIKKDKVVRVEALRNNEGPKYMDMARPLLDKWNGQKVKQAQAQKVDAVTGATFTSNALIENVRQGLKYYAEKK